METTAPRKAGGDAWALAVGIACALALGAGTAWLRMRSGALTVEALRDGAWFAFTVAIVVSYPLVRREQAPRERRWNDVWMLFPAGSIVLSATATVSHYLAIHDTPLAVLRAQAEGTVRVEDAYATTLVPLILIPVVVGMSVSSSSARGRHFLRSLGGWMLPLSYLVAAGFIVAGWQVGVLRQGPVTAVTGVAGLSIGLLVAVRATVLWHELEAEVRG